MLRHSLAVLGSSTSAAASSSLVAAAAASSSSSSSSSTISCAGPRAAMIRLCSTAVAASPGKSRIATMSAPKLSTVLMGRRMFTSSPAVMEEEKTAAAEMEKKAIQEERRDNGGGQSQPPQTPQTPPTETAAGRSGPQTSVAEALGFGASSSSSSSSAASASASSSSPSSAGSNALPRSVPWSPLGDRLRSSAPLGFRRPAPPPPPSDPVTEMESAWAARAPVGARPVTPYTGRSVLVSRPEMFSVASRNLAMILKRNDFVREWRRQERHEKAPQKRGRLANQRHKARFLRLIQAKIKLVTKLKNLNSPRRPRSTVQQQ